MNILEVEKAWRSLFLDSPTFNRVSWAPIMLMAHGVREGVFLPLSFHLIHLRQSQLLKFTKDQIALPFFFSLCNILKSWKVLWNSSVYRAQVKA